MRLISRLHDHQINKLRTRCIGNWGEKGVAWNRGGFVGERIILGLPKINNIVHSLN